MKKRLKYYCYKWNMVSGLLFCVIMVNGKYLYAIIPSVTVILAVLELVYEINNGDIMHILIQLGTSIRKSV